MKPLKEGEIPLTPKQEALLQAGHSLTHGPLQQAHLLGLIVICTLAVPDDDEPPAESSLLPPYATNTRIFGKADGVVVGICDTISNLSIGYQRAIFDMLSKSEYFAEMRKAEDAIVILPPPTNGMVH